jgi:predicted phosphoribosyltransferase
MRAAVKAFRQEGAARIVVAAPVGSSQTCSDFRDEVDEVLRVGGHLVPLVSAPEAS